MPPTNDTGNARRSEERSLAARIKIYYDLHVPAGDAAAGPRPLLVALHGYGDNKEWMLRVARLFAPEDFAVASLQGFHQHIKRPKDKTVALGFGFGWLTSYRPEESVALHHGALLDLINALTAEGAADPRRVFLLGFSQSCALNYRFAFTHAGLLRGVVGLCGGIPGDWHESGLYRETEAGVFHVYGERDEFYPPERVRDYAARLSTRARDVTVRAYDAAHEISPAMIPDVRAWLAERAASPDVRREEVAR
ncbi:MAG TPA: hypothetical protein VER08_06620 [Pyrinomonadaceae bacterium]|nr:hypothetical protein [Pyrinomonadaceae bacterium]